MITCFTANLSRYRANSIRYLRGDVTGWRLPSVYAQCKLISGLGGSLALQLRPGRPLLRFLFGGHLRQQAAGAGGDALPAAADVLEVGELLVGGVGGVGELAVGDQL